jgi:DNA-binding beta-propeller fold protein YncE
MAAQKHGKLQTITIATGIAIAVVLVIAETRWTAAAQTSAKPAREAPKFQVDPAWPKIPNGWVLGQVASAATDEQDNVWVLHRPRVVRPGVKTGPPVMEFDAAGNYIQGWGGAATGYDWPKSEHGIYVDYKGFVWIGGQGNDDQILKFTKAGKFVMQIGQGGHKKSNQDTKNFWRPADVFVYPKTNELFVADGYGNKRIIVFDADTGAYKRMWGAFGNVPMDTPPHPAGEGETKGEAALDLSRIPAKEIDPKDPGPAQFSTVHGVKVSNDGLVYVSDRGGKRVQVFTIDGKFVTQAYVDRWCEAPHCGNGHTVASTAFSADPAQRFLYIASRSPERIWVYDRKTLQPLDSFGRPGVAPGEFYVLHHMTSDSKGNLYSSEVEDGRRIQKFVLKGIVPLPAK